MSGQTVSLFTYQEGYYVADVLYSVRGQGVKPVPLEDTYLKIGSEAKFHQPTLVSH